MPKIAFVDVDMTLVNNQTSAYNDTLIHFLASEAFSQVYLVTGRNTNDFWQHVLQMGEKPENWRKQLLSNIKLLLEQREINLAGISTPYDHYLRTEPSSQFNITQAGDAAEQFYLRFERIISDYRDELINCVLLTQEFNQITGGNRYVEFPGGEANQTLTNALPMYLAMTGDTEKRGQFQCLLERVTTETEDNLDVFYFDDKPENLDVAKALFESHDRISTFQTVLVDRVEGYQLDLDTDAENSGNPNGTHL
ncbi:MAG: hypothetical protein K0U37_01305 [Gammaproteobacteria bacterium]|nr:hypothetical protein [Gammaproteobacteria bacterium]